MQNATDPLSYRELSLDEKLLVAVIEQRFRWLTDAGCEPAHALHVATHPEIELSPTVRLLRPAPARPSVAYGLRPVA